MITVHALFLCLSAYYCPMVPGLPAHPSPYYASQRDCEDVARQVFGRNALETGYRCLSRRVEVWQ